MAPGQIAEHGGRRRRLVLTPAPLQGHMSPMLQLATFLHSKGFSITVAHSDLNPPNPLNHPDFTFLSLCDKSSAKPEFADAAQFLHTLNDKCRTHFKEYLNKIINDQNYTSEQESIVIICDHVMFFAGSVAAELGLPSIVLRSCSASYFPAVKIVPRLHQEGRYPVQDSMMQEIVSELDPLRYKDLPFIGQPIQQTLQMVNMVVPKTPPSAYVWNTIEFLEQSALTQIRNHDQVKIFTVGPLHKIIPTPSTSFIKEDTSCISWLDKQAPKSVIYVSLGSIGDVDEKVSIEMAWGLANSNQPFLWVIRPGFVRGFEWIEFLPEGLVTKMNESGLIVKWAPQKEVLAHFAVGGFWSHCGWNSTLESMFEGVPLLCQPFEVDQKVNCRYLSYVWKIGVEFVVERGEIEDAIRRVLVGEEGEEMRQRAMEIKEKVKAAISDGGSSKNSLEEFVEYTLSL